MEERIKIIATPRGYPEWTRKELVGEILPIMEKIMTAPDGRGVRNVEGYKVSVKTIIKTLHKKNPEAAQCWKKNINPAFIDWIIFQAEVCQLLEM